MERLASYYMQKFSAVVNASEFGKTYFVLEEIKLTNFLIMLL